MAEPQLASATTPAPVRSRRLRGRSAEVVGPLPEHCKLSRRGPDTTVVVLVLPGTGEHVDGHQVCFTTFLAAREIVDTVTDEIELHRLLDRCPLEATGLDAQVNLCR